MNPYRIIQRKRDGAALTAEEIDFFFGGYLRGTVPDYQVAALLMAIYFQGMTSAELDKFVEIMLHSGVVLDLSHVRGVKVDKHSTGGVGDKTSLALAPLVASLGVPVPMMSGRGLGHTGGTVDKLESIPGFRVELSVEESIHQVERIGCALITQTGNLAPLDKRLYGLRDVTGTVEAIPLIAASIMSKKIASGTDALVLDVKVGNGAFIEDPARASELARTMIRIGSDHGQRVVALLTAMDRPLGFAIGNALEVEEAIHLLRDEGPPDLREITLALATEMLVLGDAAAEPGEARRLAEAALGDGRALDKLRQVIEAQGGNPGVVDDPALLPHAPVRSVVTARATGMVTWIDTRAIGNAAVMLGAGRQKLDDVVDPGVGVHMTAKPGQAIERDEPFATVTARSEEAAEAAAAAIRRAVRIEESVEAEPLPLIVQRLDEHGHERPLIAVPA